jgi:hypothetical protein
MFLKSLNKMLVGLSFFACASAFAAPLAIDIAGVESHGFLGDPDNTVLLFDVGANSHITGVSYSVNLTAFDPSWLSEIGLAFTNTNFEGVIFNPGFEDLDSGTGSYADSVDLVSIGLDFFVGADGLLVLEFYEDWDDFLGVDGTWNFGTITFDIVTAEQPPAEVPEPATALLLGGGLALIGYTGRRRRAAAKGSAPTLH